MLVRMEKYFLSTHIMIFPGHNGTQVSGSPWAHRYWTMRQDLYSGFERIPDKLWSKKDTHSENHFPILNDRLVFVRYAKINLKFMAHNIGASTLNETTDFFFYSSNINCSDELADALVPDCINVTFLHGTDINALKGLKFNISSQQVAILLRMGRHRFYCHFFFYCHFLFYCHFYCQWQ